jgi:hypothetical protein
MKPIFNPLYPFQPFQGCFADIVSLNIENSSGQLRILSKNRPMAIKKKQRDQEKYRYD